MLVVVVFLVVVVVVFLVLVVVVFLVGASDRPGVQGARETPDSFLLLELNWLDENISPPTLKRSVEESTLTKEIVFLRE